MATRWCCLGAFFLVVAAIVCDAVAYRLQERERLAMSRRGVIISLAAGFVDGDLLSLRFASDERPQCTPEALCSVVLLCRRRCPMCRSPFNYLLMRKPLDTQKPVPMSGFFTAPFALAYLGKRWRSDLVYRRRVQLCRLARPHSRTRCFVFDRSGCDDDLRCLGRFLSGANSPRPRRGRRATCSGCLYCSCAG